MSRERQKFPRILLVEDRMEDSKLFKIVMKEVASSVEVLTFINGAELLHFLEDASAGEGFAQVIFIDINLPGRSGLDYLSEIKNHPTWKRMPVVVFSSSTAPADIIRAYLSYANSYVEKPLEVDAFRQLLKIIGDYWLHAVTF